MMTINTTNHIDFEPVETEDTLSTTADYDSGWQLANNHSNNTMAFMHNLGEIPSQINIMFSVDKQVAYPLTWSWDNALSGNPVTISMSTENVLLEIFAGSALHGVWTPPNEWSLYTQGYFRVIASK